MTTMIDSIRYLLGTTAKGDEWVSRYSIEDMNDIFTPDQINELDKTGKTTQATNRGELIVWIDMVASARNAFIEA